MKFPWKVERKKKESAFSHFSNVSTPVDMLKMHGNPRPKAIFEVENQVESASDSEWCSIVDLEGQNIARLQKCPFVTDMQSKVENAREAK